MSNQVTWVVVADARRATIYGIPRGMARLREVIQLDRGPGDTDGAFAADLARHLEQAQADGRFDELVLVAAPGFLSSLRATLSRPARGALVGAIEKDMTGARREVLQEEVLRVL